MMVWGQELEIYCLLEIEEATKLIVKSTVCNLYVYPITSYKLGALV